MVTIGYKETLWVNLALLVVIALVVGFTSSPMPLLALFALRDVPIQAFESPLEEEISNPIGFVHSE